MLSRRSLLYFLLLHRDPETQPRQNSCPCGLGSIDWNFDFSLEVYRVVTMACYVFLRSNGDSVLQHKAQSNFESREMIREVYENN